jgi:hypothetical protein
MSARHLLGVRQDMAGRIEPVFAEPDVVMDPLAHHHAVVGYLRAGHFAPVSFTSAQAPADIATRLATRGAAVSDAITDQATHVELGVRIILPAAPAAGSRSANGRSYLHQAAMRLKERDATTSCVARIEQLACPSCVRRLSAEAASIALAVKVLRSDARDMAAAIESCSDAGLTAEVTGPWPLYSFGLAEVLS